MTASTPLRVLVTGASGFVGGVLFARLDHDAGFEVSGIGRRPGFHPAYRSLDLSAPEAAAALDDVLADLAPDVVVHAAARSEPWGTVEQFTAQNVTATTRIVRAAARAARRPRIVHISSASVLYDGHDRIGVAGDAAPARGLGIYARTKAAAESVVREYPGEWVVLRPRAVFGAGDTTLVPRLLDAARRGRLPRFGQGPAGPALSDLVPVDTLVEYIVRAATAPGARGRTLAVTGGDPVRLEHEVFRLLEREGIPLPRRTIPRSAALALGAASEAVWRLARRSGEPPVTRYTVAAYAYSFTFDARPTVDLLGPPLVTTRDGLDALQLREAVS
ncbi:NAD(P)-dependent oxidoreductase [Herbiconiux moechotypicola]|uniref:NAD(P)-dependent oxidoreductase n=1 Tax=Herbiconiux moechotypicola TaxID=637393 RepID=A0ABP5QIT2_9MICO|nr:NAD(P)-dependent oxidoreductase [Herbiconiux moechotypicola]MCS5730366.1 NAD(P)-dependent oxidoreductase [Herbiconiux moechotypicola]